MAAKPSPERAFASALGDRRFGPGGTAMPAPSAAPVIPIRQPAALREGAIELGRASNGDVGGSLAEATKLIGRPYPNVGAEARRLQLDFRGRAQ